MDPNSNPVLKEIERFKEQLCQKYNDHPELAYELIHEISVCTELKRRVLTCDHPVDDDSSGLTEITGYREEISRKVGEHPEQTEKWLREIQLCEKLEHRVLAYRSGSDAARESCESSGTNGDLDGLTEVQALRKLARWNHGYLSAQFALPLLKNAGLLKSESEKVATLELLAMIDRCGLFQQTYPGVYHIHQEIRDCVEEQSAISAQFACLEDKDRRGQKSGSW